MKPPVYLFLMPVPRAFHKTLFYSIDALIDYRLDTEFVYEHIASRKSIMHQTVGIRFTMNPRYAADA